jgi:hypothetical protein
VVGVRDVLSLLPKLRAMAAELEGFNIEKGDELLEATLHAAIDRSAEGNAATDLEGWLVAIMSDQQAALNQKQA